MQKLIKALNEPFPDQSDICKTTKDSIIVGVFVTLFLYLFKPFDLSNYQGNHFVVCFSFGIITTMISLLYDVVTRQLFKIQKDLTNWTMWKWMIDVLCMILIIAIANYCFLCLYFQYFEWNLYSFLRMLWSTFLVGIFPVILFGLVAQRKASFENEQAAAAIQPLLSVPNQPQKEPLKKVEPKEEFPELIQLNSQNKNHSLNLRVEQFLYAESLQNYVGVHYVKNDQVEKEVLRSTISSIASTCEHSSIIRCHRSFIVNTLHIEKVEGNAQGLRLTLKQVDDVVIPVSRKFINLLKQKIELKNNDSA